MSSENRYGYLEFRPNARWRRSYQRRFTNIIVRQNNVSEHFTQIITHNSDRLLITTDLAFNNNNNNSTCLFTELVLIKELGVYTNTEGNLP